MGPYRRRWPSSVGSVGQPKATDVDIVGVDPSTFMTHIFWFAAGMWIGYLWAKG